MTTISLTCSLLSFQGVVSEVVTGDSDLVMVFDIPGQLLYRIGLSCHKSFYTKHNGTSCLWGQLLRCIASM